MNNPLLYEKAGNILSLFYVRKLSRRDLVQHCISIMRAKVLNLNKLNINKHIGMVKNGRSDKGDYLHVIQPG